MNFHVYRHSIGRPHQGIALVTMLSVVALMTVLIVAMLSISQTELKSAKVHADGQQAKQLAEVAVNVVISQLRKATTQNTNVSGLEAWTSQPGVVRRHSTNGQVQTAYKLYSSPELILRSVGQIERQLLEDDVPPDWQTNPHRYVDLNRPTVRITAQGQPLLLFPILDPRAQAGSQTVEGFSYGEQTSAGQKISGVRTTGGDTQRVPMPVEWLYVLKDGTLGSLNEFNHFVGPKPATADNPITGRIAFWTDDEASKVNINTASEPTPWAMPTFFYDQDAGYARYQPVAGEFQRYPGHPASTALSPILFPGQTLTVGQKESIYELAPKVGPGGSRAGTRSYSDPEIEAVALTRYRRERLYASLDELLLAEDRQRNVLAGEALEPERIQRSGFFLTAHSRAPEANPFGMPKIAVWPVSYRGAAYRTAFDQLIAHCATLRTASGKRSYIFQRGWADSTTQDITQEDNSILLASLMDQWAKPIPGFASSAGQSFQTKYGQDTAQILVEIFDYIRAVNLHDGNLIKPEDRINGDGNAQNFMLGYAPGSARPTSFKTFTDPRFFGSATEDDDPDASDGLKEKLGFPGHGQVTPSQWNYQGRHVQGIGRFPTITEVGLHFICAADNTNDPNNPLAEVYPHIGKPGGGSAEKGQLGINPPTSPTDRWYSNFPPRPKPNPAAGEKANLNAYPLTNGFPYGPEKTHPGYQRENWNHQLEANTPLRPGYRRVQARLLLEFFVPGAGYTLLEPDVTVKVSGLASFRVNGQSLFPKDEEFFYTGRRATHPGAQMQGGYGIGLKGLLRGREVPARAPMPADANWGKPEWIVKPAEQNDEHRCVLNYDLISNYVDINVGANGELPMELQSVQTGNPVILTVEIYSGHVGRSVTVEETPAQLVQVLQPAFPAASLKPPTLVRTAARPVGADLGREPPAWWTFNSRGAVGISQRDSLIGRDKLGPNSTAYLRGRLFRHNLAPSVANKHTMGAFFFGFDPAVAGAPRLFRTQNNANTQVKIDEAEELEGSDVVQTVMIRHGDYRLTAAKMTVPSEDWSPHRYYGKQRLAHSFTNFVSNQLPGYDYGGNTDFDKRLVPNKQGAGYANHRIPDLPYNTEASVKAQRYGDFDNGPGPHRDGPYINKPDEGNLNIVAGDKGIAYFSESSQHRTTEQDFYSPNRMMPSPVMFGSLPTSVKAGDPWRTLLFRPQRGHPGGPSRSGGTSPADHLLLEFFWMPVVEPYAISEPFSTAGKVNLNYQILPFTHIRRATGMHSVLKGEVIHAVPNEDAPNYKVFPDSTNQNGFWGQAQAKQWHYKIDAEKTLVQFDERFAQGRVFISPSEICEIHLVPQAAPGVSSHEQMESFWADHRLTGDNTRERPYAGIYPRVTTRSNTFLIHYISQTIQKARSTHADQVSDLDKVTGEFRGSTLIERHLDPTQAGLPDFATNAAGRTLDHYHEFRILQTQRFGF
ncbi:Verru_Chthon cassette protein A [Prosthecobacter debontii]|uniref:Verru_Chthon cassette protein A n=1 Tax=Prosthecobacter debontii TaxID=48467 RepID=A0A1T4XMY3_9BACT|nr:Verru_Chthon cassette protein A [Prosthecobacter debontii]SKA90471.1 Verru_Chthon cassette protein A [Prosthecobacter debontii]